MERCTCTYYPHDRHIPKIHKRLSDVPGRPVISNCRIPTEKVSEFLDYQLKQVMQNGKSYIRDSQHFREKKWRNLIILLLILGLRLSRVKKVSHFLTSERKLKTALHIKSTDCHKYLHHASSHPEHN